MGDFKCHNPLSEGVDQRNRLKGKEIFSGSRLETEHFAKWLTKIKDLHILLSGRKSAEKFYTEKVLKLFCADRKRKAWNGKSTFDSGHREGMPSAGSIPGSEGRKVHPGAGSVNRRISRTRIAHVTCLSAE